MKKKIKISFMQASVLLCLAMAVGPAAAHVSAMHSVNGFQAGFLHPLMGLDHLLAMLAVGIWAAQHQRPAIWLLPVAFPVMMAAGALLGVTGVLIPGVEAGIAASVLILGLLIATSVKLALPFSVSLIAVFAMMHGYAHGVELPLEAGAVSFGLGFVLSSILLHAIGFGLTMVASRLMNGRFIRYAGTSIAMMGLFFVSAMT